MTPPRFHILLAWSDDDKVELYLTQPMGLPVEAVAHMRAAPFWPGMEVIAHTLAYDFAILGDTMSGSPGPLRQWASVTVPMLVIDGGASPAFMHHGARALVEVLPQARGRTLEGQTHAVAPEVLAPVLETFFGG